MRFQTTAMLFALSFISMGFICGGNNNDDDDNDGEGTQADIPDGPDGTDGTDVTTAGPALNPTAASVSGVFGWDARTGQIREYTADGTVVQPQVVLQLRNDLGESCAFIWRQTTRTEEADWVNSAGSDVYGGFTPASGSASVVETDCDEWSWSDNTYGGTEDFIERISDAGIGIAVSELNNNDAPVADELENQVIQQLGQSAWNNDWAPFVVGGGFYADMNDGQGGQYLGLDYSFGAEVDADFAIEFDDANFNGVQEEGEADVLIPVSSYNGSTLPTGVYLIQPYYEISAEFIELP